jgi:hypothetical protein
MSNVRHRKCSHSNGWCLLAVSLAARSLSPLALHRRHAQAVGAAASALQGLRTYRIAPSGQSQCERAYKRRALAQGQRRWRAQNARVSAGEHSLALNARHVRMKP